MRLTKYPKNKEKVIRLLDFLSEILGICKYINVYPILDGSLAVFLYSQNEQITVNDIDLTYSERYFPKILKALSSQGFNTEIKEWHVLQCRKDAMKVEFGDPDYWYPNVPIEIGDYLEFENNKIGILKFESLVRYYEIGSKNLQKELPEKQQKYEDVKKKLKILKTCKKMIK